MAPQWLEKIESAPGNGMASDASKPQDVVRGRAADRAIRLEHGLKSGIGAATREKPRGSVWAEARQSGSATRFG